MRTGRIVVVALGVVALLAAYAAASGPPKLDAALTAYKTVSGVTGNLSSVGSDSLNNVMTLWGEGLSADEVGAAAGTLSYELLCKVTARVPVIEVA